MWFRRIFNADPVAREKTQPARANGNRRPAVQQSGPAQLALSAATMRQLNRLQLVTGRAVPGTGLGERASHRRRPSPDFREHRAYAPGDDFRFVDWRASARQEHVFIKQGEQLKNVTVTLLVDCSASMNWGNPPKSRAALELAAALGYLALAYGDRLAVLPLVDPQAGQTRPPLRPVSGKGQFPSLLNYLRSLSFGGQIDLGQALAGLSRSSRGGGLALVVSDLLGTPDLSTGLQSLASPGWNVALLHLLHREELEPGLSGDFELQDIETRQVRRYTVDAQALEIYRQRLQAWQGNLEAACRERGVRYTLVPADGSLESQVLPTLRAAGVVKPL
jgi:uncharacterized protein (DUF58 family)